MEPGGGREEEQQAASTAVYIPNCGPKQVRSSPGFLLSPSPAGGADWSVIGGQLDGCDVESYSDDSECSNTLELSSVPDESYLEESDSDWGHSNASICDDLREISDLEDQSEQSIQVVLNVVSAPPPSSLPPPPWYEEYCPRPPLLPSSRHTVRRDNRLLTGASLPSFSAPNCRSLAPKVRYAIEDMKMRSISCILASETWTKESNKKHQKEVERMFEMEGLKMISKPRKYRRGGGVCIIADISKVSISLLEIPAGNLEIVWALVKPLQ